MSAGSQKAGHACEKRFEFLEYVEKIIAVIERYVQ
jgi:hypothetical protein